MRKQLKHKRGAAKVRAHLKHQNLNILSKKCQEIYLKNVSVFWRQETLRSKFDERAEHVEST